MKRLNLAHKPMIIGLKANVAEIAATYQAHPPMTAMVPETMKSASVQARISSTV